MPTTITPRVRTLVLLLLAVTGMLLDHIQFVPKNIVVLAQCILFRNIIEYRIGMKNSNGIGKFTNRERCIGM